MRFGSRLFAALVLTQACAGATDRIAPPDDSLRPQEIKVDAGAGQTGEVGTELSQPIVVTIENGLDAVMPNQLVNFVVVSGGGHVFAGSALTNGSGQVQDRWTLGTVAGPQVLEVRAIDQTTGDPIVFSTVEATATPGPLASATFTVHQVRIQADSVLELPIRAVDSYGNAVPAPKVTVLGSVGTLNGTTWTADGIGIATFEMNGDTLTGIVVLPNGHIRIQYQWAQVTAIEEGDLEMLPVTAAHSSCRNQGPQVDSTVVVYRVTNFNAYRSDQDSFPRTGGFYGEYLCLRIPPVGVVAPIQAEFKQQVPFEMAGYIKYESSKSRESTWMVYAQIPGVATVTN